MTAENRQIVSDFHTGKQTSELTKLKISKSNTGKRRTDEAKLLMSKSAKSISAELRKQMSLSLKGRPTWHTKTTIQNNETYEMIVIQWRDRKQYLEAYTIVEHQKYAHLWH